MKKIIDILFILAILSCMTFQTNNAYSNVSTEETYIILEPEGEGHHHYGNLDRHHFQSSQSIICVRHGDKISVTSLPEDAIVFFLDKGKNVIMTLPYTKGYPKDIIIPTSAFYIVVTSNNKHYQARL